MAEAALILYTVRQIISKSNYYYLSLGNRSFLDKLLRQGIL